MVAGTSYTVTSGNATCTSVASASFSNAAQLPTPAVPTISSTAATCAAAGSSTITNYLAANTYTFSPAGPTVGAGGLISGMVAGTSYTVTSGNATCTSVASASFSNAAQLPTPAVPTIGTITQPTCALNTGSVVLNGLPTGNWIINPGAISGSGSSFTISGLAPVNDNFTVTNSAGCTSTAAPVTINIAPGAPASPVASATSTADVCSTDSLARLL